MPDIIQLLPDSVANQIAAGEVIQRPASVIKELVENAVDAGANSISIIIKDSGRTLIQVVDNGFGMSETDARMAFERHATSKIKKADDLFAIRSMGFRGEALASIAAIAEVSLQTKRQDDELGTELIIKATDVISQEPIACQTGCNFAVKNLFFNVPARRKFLKSDTYEFRLIISEIQRVALAFPEIEFKLMHNNTEILQLVSSNHKQRIIQLFGKNQNQALVDIKTNTSIVKLYGFTGKPEFAKKSQGEQFFFVNNRYMRHPYFHKAVIHAYEKIIAPDTFPTYFIFLEINPENIDVNIHPTKTEIKFEDEQSIWQIIHATVKEALGKFNVVPSIDFNNESAIEIPVLNKNTEVKIPVIHYNPNFNPFDSDAETKTPQSGQKHDYFKQSNLKNWETLFAGFENEKLNLDNRNDHNLFGNEDALQITVPIFMQLKYKYILSPVKSGLMIIDQKRAHERILYEKYLKVLSGSAVVSQQTIFPQVIELSSDKYNLLLEFIDDINYSGFDIRDFGNNSVVVNGCPADLVNPNTSELIERIIEGIEQNPKPQATRAREHTAMVLSKASSIGYGKVLSNDEMHDLVEKLFQCPNHNFSPDGNSIISIISIDEIERKMN
jgi:DNA mismatch repair protein MutL